MIVVAGCMAPAAHAAARSAEELNALASLRFQSAQTDVVAARVSDAKIVALRQQVAQSETSLAKTRTQLKTLQTAAREDEAAIADLTRRLDALLTDLAAAKTAFTEELAQRDTDYARDIAVLQLAGEQLLTTPEGMRALELYNAGGPDAFEAADTVLGQIEEARTRAREDAALIQKAEDRRARARLALDARDRGLTTTGVAIERWEAVLAVGKPVVRDWTNLADLYLEAGLVGRALDAANKAMALATTDEQRAIALSRLGTARGDANDEAGSLAAYRELLTINRRRAAEEPASAERMRLVTLALRLVGQTLLAQGDVAGARRQADEALAIDQRRLELAPTMEVRREISIDLSALAAADSAEGKNEAALTRLRDVVGRDREILAADPELMMSRRNVAVSLQALASGEMEYGRYADAVQILREVMKIDDGLIADDPASATYLADKVYDSGLLASALLYVGEREEGQLLYFDALDLARQIVKIDPSSAKAQARLADSLSEATRQMSLTYDFSAIMANYNEALAIERTLLAANPSPARQQSTAAVLSDIAIANELSERFEAAIPPYREALELLLLVEKRDRSISIQFDLAGIHQNLADIMIKTRDIAAGLKHAQAAVAIRRKILEVSPARGGMSGMANSLDRLATALQQTGNLRESLAIRQEAIEIRRKLLAGSQSVDVDREALALALLSAANTAAMAKDAAFEQAAYRESLEILRDLAARDPKSVLNQIIFSLNNYAKAVGTQPALKFELLEERVRLLRDHNDASYLASVIFDLARARRDAGETAEALKQFEDAQTIIRAAIEAKPTLAGYRRTFAEAALDVARMKRTEAAWTDALTALEAWRALGARFDEGNEMIAEAKSHLPGARAADTAPIEGKTD
jgi:tetratricopeptide (TPR) repeat protein